VTLAVTCGSGTYIRSLARDIGAALGVGGHLTGLRRTRSGGFDVSHAVQLEQLRTADNPHSYLIAPQAALSDYPTVVLDTEAVTALRHGQVIPAENAPEDDTITMGYDAHSEFVAVLRAARGVWKPHKVF
jgi:tRNA pseudouridine55 synthase